MTFKGNFIQRELDRQRSGERIDYKAASLRNLRYKLSRTFNSERRAELEAKIKEIESS